MKRMSFLMLVLGAALLFQGCDIGSADNVSKKKLRLAFVAGNASDYWSLVRLGCDNAVKQLGDVELDFRTPRDRTAAAQQEILKEVLASGVDGIAICPIDAEQEKDFLNSIPTNVLLVCADSDAETSRRAAYIGTDNVAAGMQAAELLRAALPQGGKITIFVGYPNAQNAKERIQGIQNGLAGSNLQIVDTLTDDTKPTVAQKNAEDALAKYPDLAGMVGLYSYDGPAILMAARSAGKAGQVKIVCFDEDSDTLAAITAGEIYGTVVQKPYMIGLQTILCLENCLRGNKTELATGRILITSNKITRENVVQFQTTMKNVLQ